MIFVLIFYTPVFFYSQLVAGVKYILYGDEFFNNSFNILEDFMLVYFSSLEKIGERIG